MTEEVNDIIKSVSINQILISILEHHGKISVPTVKFLESANINKQLVIDFEESGPNFIFSLRSENE